MTTWFPEPFKEWFVSAGRTKTKFREIKRLDMYTSYMPTHTVLWLLAETLGRYAARHGS
jgi:hypothetical protein